MSQGFTFPPPPPPPPSRSTITATTSTSTAAASWRGHSGAGRASGQAPRGHGRGGGRAHRGAAASHPYRGGPSHSTWTSNSYNRHYPESAHLSSSSRPSAHRGMSGSAEAVSGSVRPVAKRDFDAAFVNLPLSGKSLTNLTSAASVANPEDKSRARAGNLLGLTPVAALESESEGELEDEEHLAQADGSALHFEYNGRTATLKTPEEIAAWITERRKRWPTQAKRDTARALIEEKRAKYEKEKAARLEAAKSAAKFRQENYEKQRKEREMAQVRQRLLREQVYRAREPPSATAELSPAQLKAERLRRRAEKVARQLERAESEADAQKGPNYASALNTQADVMDLVAQTDLAAASKDAAPVSHALEVEDDALSDIDSNDDTSSSGSSSSDSDSDGPPEESSSRQLHPESSQSSKPPDLEVKLDNRPVCRNFASSGKCKYGRKCNFKHDPKLVRPKQQPGSRRRQGLFQIMVQKEQEEAAKMAVSAILALGDAGMLQS